MSLSAANKTFFPRTLWRSFLVTLFFVTLASFLFWLDSFRVYQAELTMLVLAKSQAVDADQTASDLSELSKTLSFYDRVLSGTDLLDDDFEGYTPDQRRVLWNETVQVAQSDKGGVLTVTARQDEMEKAKRLAEETSKALLSVTSFYYNVKTDIDLRVVDGPIVSTVVAHPWKYGAVSIGSGLVATALFFLVLAFIPALFENRSSVSAPQYHIGETVPLIDPQKFVPARPTNLTFESVPEETVEEAPAAVPLEELAEAQNERMLPGMDVAELPFEFEETYREDSLEGPEGEVFTNDEEPEITEILPVEEEIEEEKVPEIPKGEPTVEEYKRRLNELLAGGR